jgi:hypothetical protein
MGQIQERKTSFLKKRSKKLLRFRSRQAAAPQGQEFFGSFFQK